MYRAIALRFISFYRAELERIVATETENGNPIASLIVGMDLGNGRITLRLADPYADDEEDEVCLAVRVM